MEPIQQPMQPIMTYAPIQKRKRKTWIVVVAAIVVAAIAGSVWFFFLRKPAKELTPIETLQQLEQASKPVTATPAEQKAELDALAKQSAPVKATVDQREQGLRQLRGETQQ